ncbi:uncharacterized protein MONOS_5690 [Monocercomonoides exilis]|uniref:uncharacterized protein n=1 Tax=Monocercomonoides exilis TaxID=2049356 RepID=UPI0035598036|nr:hypothetical protein MONOS_5690 [Monocercomonoides exilis]|eukprot:MONOS_5690.1-p1 / transcript=MONOS_5690.1 / gene=MONOS_5690 / organism=Monocercomonoides_exilis_PA203 / gene_product=unspecified product / transcript_product=unspecified product / location=Mono_scaffold00169:1982-9004(+) / protein_length=2016 / sequence_SO=supercontig / SO=protein_coding / is_pseudo=false
MSVKYDKNSDYQISHSCFLSSIKNCLIYSCVNVFEGGISSGSLSSEKFVCVNTTISNGKRETNALQKKEQMNTTESQTFSLCEWTDCTAEQGGALFVHDNENAILTVENSSFARCNASSSNGGGIFALNIAECIVIHTIFIQCTTASKTNSGGGGIKTENINTQSMVDDCTFNFCSSGDDGGAIYVYRTKTQRQKNCIINSFFDDCQCNSSSDGAGGAILHWGPVDKVIISNCHFCNCHSMCGGGAVCQNIYSNNDGILFYYCFFHNNLCAKGGHDIALHSSTKNNIDSSCYSTRQTENRVSSDFTKIADRSEWLHNDFGNTRFVSSIDLQQKGRDTFACGLDKIHSCCTISRCLTQLIPDFVTNIEVFSGTITETKSVDCGTNSFTIYGRSDLSSTVQIEFKTSGLSLFSVSTGTLITRDFVLVYDPVHSNNRGSRLFEISGAGGMSINKLNISIGSGQSTEIAFTRELINVQNGMFQMEHVNLAKTISTNSLFSLSLTNEVSLTLSECTFDGIERTTSGAAVMLFSNDKANIDMNSCFFEGCGSGTSTDGGSMMLCVGNENEVRVKGGTFDGCFCSASNGLGGGILLRLLNENSEFLISSSFGTNTAKWGNDIFVLSPNLEETAKSENIRCVTDSLDSLEKVRGYDNGNTSVAIPLCIYLLPTPEEIYVSNVEASNHSHCGIVEFPCLTMKHSLTRQTGEKKIVVNGMILMSDELAFAGQKHEIRGNDDQSGWTVSDTTTETNTAMVTFVIPSSFTSGVNYLMHVESSEGLLTVKDCSFTKNEENNEGEIMNYGLIKADGGTVVLELVSIQSLGFSHDVVSVLSTTILNIYNLTMKSIELEGASGLKISKSSRREKNEEEQDVVIEWSSFEEVTQNTTDDIPIIRNANDDEPLKMAIRNTTMKRCGGLKCGKGGGMFCMLNEGGSFDCSFSTISECFCSTTGRGGWLFLECCSVAEHPLSFVLSNLTFKDNTALRGRDVYVRCHSIETQIVDEQFLLDFRAPFVKELAMWGCSTDSFEGEEDLLLRVVKYQSETIFVSACAENHSDFNSCGELHGPCESLNVGVKHIIPSSYSQLLISKETAMRGKCSIHDVVVHPLESPPAALVHLSFAIVNDAGYVITTSGKVRIESVKLDFGQSFSFSGSSVVHETSGQLSLSFVDFSSVGESNSIQPVVLNSSLLSIESGIVHVDNCSVSLLSFKKPSFLLSGDEISLTNVKLDEIESTADVFEIGSCGIMSINGVSADGVKLSDGCILAIGSSSSGTISVGSSSFDNCSRNSEGASVLSASSTSAHFEFSNCSCTKCYSLSDKGRVMEVINMKDAYLNMCEFEGLLTSKALLEHENDMKEICEWNGSVVHSTNSTMVMKYTTISNASSGGFSVSAGDVTIEKGEFLNNNPFIEKYPSLRRNIICSDSASLTISSLKGGDGLKDNSSLWILNDGCTLGGIAGERPSPFFIPRLEEVSVNESGSKIFIQFKGSLFVPCDLSFRLVYKTGDVELVETYRFEEDSFVSENEVIGRVPSENISLASDETEVSVTILFGKQSAETFPLILKNRSEHKGNGDERIAEGRKEGKSIWPIIVIIACIVCIILLVVIIVLAVRWRRAKIENKDLREIVNDSVKKDPKAFEMVTMEMSPEEQWRRAEREAEKKNEERIKKRVYEKSLGHSESSEHLLSESGSTEYILGRDSDKIPEWMLEKVEEEEIRKQTPSPSISSTSTTSTTDSDSTFVRGEDLCPTTSSMSNLVDAIACSSPHEKLIVDLRDSLFMLLHGRNKTKEMAIGTLQEREMTAAQILFWVANLALHSFDKMENKLQSLANLSPLIVLFSEHMVICVAMHSDCSSSDSDSSSISSSTVVTSTSDDGDERDSLPSSAFEDEEDNRNECLRWKAPELLNRTKKHATKKTVVFAIGMMLWECLTLKVPFGEYEAEVAGQKIVNGERPKVEKMGGSSLRMLEEKCVVQGWDERVTLGDVKRELFMKIPMGSMFVTASDALDIGDGSRCEEADSEDTNGSFTRIK